MTTRSCSASSSQRSPRLQVSKADQPFERIKAIANTVLSAGKVRTLAQGIAKAAQENPELYAQYREAMKSEMAAQQST